MELTGALLAVMAALLFGLIVGTLIERRRLHDFVEREHKWGAEQAARADRAVDQLVLQSGGTPISALGQAEQEQRKDLEVERQAEQNEIFAEETGADRGPEEPPE